MEDTATGEWQLPENIKIVGRRVRPEVDAESGAVVEVYLEISVNTAGRSEVPKIGLLRHRILHSLAW